MNKGRYSWAPFPAWAFPPKCLTGACNNFFSFWYSWFITGSALCIWGQSPPLCILLSSRDSHHAALLFSPSLSLLLHDKYFPVLCISLLGDGFIPQLIQTLIRQDHFCLRVPGAEPALPPFLSKVSLKAVAVRSSALCFPRVWDELFVQKLAFLIFIKGRGKKRKLPLDGCA